jgi:hypothetical protein
VLEVFRFNDNGTRGYSNENVRRNNLVNFLKNELVVPDKQHIQVNSNISGSKTNNNFKAQSALPNRSSNINAVEYSANDIYTGDARH